MDDGLIKNSNSLPTFPVRKLSPQVHQRTEPSRRRRSPSSVYQLYEHSQRSSPTTTIVEKQQPQKSNRPPLSPRKNSLAGQQKGRVSINNKTAPLQAPLRHPSKTSVSQQWSPSIGHHAIKNSIFPNPSVWIGDDDDPLFLNDESVEDDDIPPPPSQHPTRGLSATLGTDLPILPPVAPVRRVSAQIYDVEEEEEEEDDTLSFYGSFLGDDDDDGDLSLQGVEDDLYLAYKAEEKLLLDFSSSSVMLSAAPLTVVALDCYISTSTTKQTQLRASRGPDVDEDLHPYLKPPRRSS
jgi:hypothetical protein